MTSFRIRPRFIQTSNENPEEIYNRFKIRLTEEDSPITGIAIPEHIILKIPPDQKHYWSPQLSLSLEKKNGVTLIRGLYGPNPNVWATFFFGYAALGIIALFTSMIGLSQWFLGLEAYSLWAIPVCLLIALILYLIAQAGQKVGAQQMYELHHFYEKIIGDRVLIN
ncbi:hypothetical protein ACFLU5_00545 [Bacteroidota bacterium]